VHGYCIFKDDSEAVIGYPMEGMTSDVAGRSFHNGRFVQRLRQCAASVPNVIVRQGIVKRLLNGQCCCAESGSFVLGLYMHANKHKMTSLVQLRHLQIAAKTGPKVKL
jgi:squalene monooxygenase